MTSFNLTLYVVSDSQDPTVKDCMIRALTFLKDVKQQLIEYKVAFQAQAMSAYEIKTSQMVRNLKITRLPFMVVTRSASDPTPLMAPVQGIDAVINQVRVILTHVKKRRAEAESVLSRPSAHDDYLRRAITADGPDDDEHDEASGLSADIQRNQARFARSMPDRRTSFGDEDRDDSRRPVVDEKTVRAKALSQLANQDTSETSLGSASAIKDIIDGKSFADKDRDGGGDGGDDALVRAMLDRLG